MTSAALVARAGLYTCWWVTASLWLVTARHRRSHSSLKKETTKLSVVGRDRVLRAPGMLPLLRNMKDKNIEIYGNGQTFGDLDSDYSAGEQSYKFGVHVGNPADVIAGEIEPHRLESSLN
ncbi:hypothetical protein V1520DRAFT_355818 [Lipomyces starkeyi]|uniref:Uncharacterized protein n=1 Tax=Lipomyces starkeyi NRRL Y-11557 TaxID=675824 RepID=A0A1E3PX10_LIPST|nr:hypothetical protein LIPSTDRAFT_66204 [Lipomyces starkeyi NRRL Y-11557]